MLRQVDLNAERATQVCGGCGTIVVIDLKTLVLSGKGNCIALLPCKCGASETLIRTFAAAFKRAPASPHHLAVNRLADYLRAKGRVAEPIRAQVAAETEAPHGAVKLAHVTKFTPAELAREFAGDTGTKG